MHGLHDYQSRQGRERDDRRIGTSQAPKAPRADKFLNEGSHSSQQGSLQRMSEVAPLALNAPRKSAPICRGHLSPELLALGEKKYYLVTITVNTRNTWDTILAALRELAAGPIGIWHETIERGRVVLQLICARPWVVEQAARQLPTRRKDITTRICEVAGASVLDREPFRRRLMTTR